MTGDEMVKELTDYFSGGYSQTLLREIKKVCCNIPDSDRDIVCETIREDNAPNYKIGVKSIFDACRKLGTTCKKQEEVYIQATNWQCDACGLQFKYAMLVTYDDKHDMGIFDYCPRCGFHPSDTIQAKAESQLQHGTFRHWYQKRIDRFLSDYKIRGKWIFDKNIDDAFIRARQKEKIDALKKAAQDEVRKLADNSHA